VKIDHLTGLIAAPFTPMTADGSLKLDRIPLYYRTLKTNRIRGAFINGTTGEGAALSLAEKKAVVEAWAACVRNDPDFTLITLVGGTCLQECIELAQHARAQRLSGVAFLAPYYYKPASVHHLAEACIQVAGAVPDMPFYYYHIPSFTGCYFPMIDLLHALDGKLDNLAGIKYTHEDFMDYLSCLRFRDGKYDLLAGRDECLLAALALGARAAVGSTYNYAAPLYNRLMDAYAAGDLERARALQDRSIAMIRLLGKYGGIAVGKTFMRFIGLDCGDFRLPVANPAPEAYAAFTADAESLGFGDLWSVVG